MTSRVRPGKAIPLGLAFLLACSGGQQAGGSGEQGDSLGEEAAAPSSLPSRESLSDAELGQIERSHVQLALNWSRGSTRRPVTEGAEPAVLEEWQVRGRESFDRLVLTFGQDDEMPGYLVQLHQGPIQDCSTGSDVELQGDAVLRIRISGVTAGGTLARDTSIRRRRNIQELRLVCETDSELEFAIGLAGARNYRILEARSPRRLVVDVVNEVGEG